MRNMSLVVKQQDADGKDFPIIGMVVSWNYAQRRYDIQHTINCARKYGFDKAFATGQNKIKAVLRALQQAKKEQLLSEVFKTSDRVEYQFTEKTLAELPNGEKYLEFKMSEKIVYDVATEQVIAGPSQAVIDELIKICSTTFVNNDITRYTMSLFKDSGMISLRDRGGMYFIPAVYKDLVENVKKMFEEIDPKGAFSIIEVPDLKNSKTTVAKSFESSIMDKKQAIKDRIELLRTKKQELSQRAFQSIIEEIAQWGKDIEMYADLTEYNLQECIDIKKECEQITTNYLLESNNLFKPTE